MMSCSELKMIEAEVGGLHSPNPKNSLAEKRDRGGADHSTHDKMQASRAGTTVTAGSAGEQPQVQLMAAVSAGQPLPSWWPARMAAGQRRVGPLPRGPGQHRGGQRQAAGLRGWVHLITCQSQHRGWLCACGRQRQGGGPPSWWRSEQGGSQRWGPLYHGRSCARGGQRLVVVRAGGGSTPFMVAAVNKGQRGVVHLIMVAVSTCVHPHLLMWWSVQAEDPTLLQLQSAHRAGLLTLPEPESILGLDS